MFCQHCKKEIPEGAPYCCWCGKVVGKIPRKPKAYHPNGSGCVFKRPGGKTYTCRVTDMSRSYRDDDGKFHRKTYEKSGFKTEPLARAWALDWYRNRTEKPPAPALSHYWKLFFDGEYQRLSKSKQTAYNIAWRRLESISSMAVDAITVAALRSVVSDQASSYYTARDIRSVLSHLFDLAGADGYVQRDLPSYIVLPKLEAKEPDAFHEDEIRAIWAAYDANDPDAAWPLIMIYTSMMPGETLSLRIEQIDLDHRVIHGAGLKTETRKKSSIYLSPTIVPVFHDLIGSRTEGRLLPFLSKAMYKRYHEFTKRVGIRDLEPYSCRHSTGTALAVDKNISPETIRKIMRWSKNSNMISHYAHPDDQAALDAVAKLTRPEEKAE